MTIRGAARALEGSGMRFAKSIAKGLSWKDCSTGGERSEVPRFPRLSFCTFAITNRVHNTLIDD